MKLETLPTYEVGPPQPTTLPPRSRLYALPPLGVGTPLVESLTSYLTRLAHAHGVTVEKLVMAEVVPLIDQITPTTRKKFRGRSQTLNGISEWTPLTIAALEKLTLQAGLTILTMETWRHVLAPFSLVRAHQAWCPARYTQWRQVGQDIYHPLLWLLKAVQLCPVHQLPLHHRCPYPDCQQPLHPVNSKVKLGYCSSCHRWLGLEPAPLLHQEWSSAEWQWRRWLTTQLGQLLAAAPRLTTQPELHVFTLNLKSCIEAGQPGNVAARARETGLYGSLISSWLHRGHRPRLELLARFCYHLNLSLLEILTPQPDLEYQQVSQTVDDGKQAASRVESEILHQQLGQLLADPDYAFTSVEQVAQHAGVTPRIILGRHPELYRQIVHRNRQVRQANSQSRRKKLAADLKVILNSDETPPPSMEEVAHRLQINSDVARLFCPELCQLIVDKRRSYYETRKVAVKTRLREILAANEHPPPSMSQIAVRLGEPYVDLYNYFPELCRAVTKRHHSYQSSRPHKTDPVGSRNQEQLRQQFLAQLAADETPPPFLTEVARRLKCDSKALRRLYPDLCRQLKQQRKAYVQARDADLRRRLTEWLAENDVLYSTIEVAEQLNVTPLMLKNQAPDLYAEIVRRRRVQRQAIWQKRQAFLDKIISENPVPPPSLPQVAADLDCNESHLRAQFPQLSKIIQKRYQLARQREKERVKAAMEAALSPEQQPPLLPIQVAQSLGYENANYLIRHFPKLCHRLCQRHEAHKRQMIRTQLEMFLAESASELPLTLNRIGWQLGYEIDTLRFHCPDLCQLLEEQYETYRAEKFRIAKQRLEAVLSGEAIPPTSVEAVAREIGFNAQTVRRRFPDLTKAVTDTYRHYVRQRSRERRQRLSAEVKRITHELYQAGFDPTLGRVAAHLPHSKILLATFLQQAWQEARQELDLPA